MWVGEFNPNILF